MERDFYQMLEKNPEIGYYFSIGIFLLMGLIFGYVFWTIVKAHIEMRRMRKDFNKRWEKF